MKKKKFILYCELIAELNFNAEACIRVASDWGVSDYEGTIEPVKKLPSIKIKNEETKFKHLPKKIIAKILELKIFEKQAERIILDILESEFAYDPMTFFIYRQIYATKIGVKLLIIAEKLRRKAKIPEERFYREKESPFMALKEIWRINLKSYIEISK